MTGGYKRLQLVTRSYNELNEDTRGYRRLEGITDNLFSKEDIPRYFFLVYLLKKVTLGYSGLLGGKGGYKGFQGLTGGYRV